MDLISQHSLITMQLKQNEGNKWNKRPYADTLVLISPEVLVKE